MGDAAASIQRASGRCPGCNRRLSVWRVVAAPMPNRLRCGGCRARLRFQVNLLALLTTAVIVLGVVVWLAQPFYAVLAPLGIVPAAALAAAAALTLWLTFELALASFLLRRRRLCLADE